MIRLAFLSVFVLAALLAFGAFFLARGTDDAALNTANTVEPAATNAEEAEPELVAQRPFYFLADQDLDTGELVLVLERAGQNGQAVVVTDRAAIKAAQNSTYVRTSTSGDDDVGAIATGILGVPPKQRIAALFRDDELILEVRCGPTLCGPSSAHEDVEFADLLTAARPLVLVQAGFESYQEYLDTLASIGRDPEFALLGLKSTNDIAHPVPRDAAEALIALPAIYSSATRPIDVRTSSAILSEMIERHLPDDVTLTGVGINRRGPAIVVDADSGLPATRGGAEIPFPDVIFYAPTFSITGASNLPDANIRALLETLSGVDWEGASDMAESNLLDPAAATSRIDWDAASSGFLQSLGLNCSDCYTLQTKGNIYDTLTVVWKRTEFYVIAYYDLRDTP